MPDTLKMLVAMLALGFTPKDAASKINPEIVVEEVNYPKIPEDFEAPEVRGWGL